MVLQPDEVRARRFRIEWSMNGSAVIEADDEDEAEVLLHEGLENFETVAFEQFLVAEVSTDSVEPVAGDG